MACRFRLLDRKGERRFAHRGVICSSRARGDKNSFFLRHLPVLWAMSQGPEQLRRRDAGAAPPRRRPFGRLSLSRNRRGGSYPRSANSEFESATVPNTPPCILIILIACSWFDRSVAPQQSSTSRHSNPR